MGAIAPALVLCLLTILVNHAGRPWRYACLAAAVTWGLWLVILTEALSPFRLITPLSLFTAWGVTFLILLGVAWRSGLRPAILKALPPRPHLDRTSASLICGLTIIAAITALIAWVAPPNTWDSMTYHMARVAHWVQNQSVAHYPTNIDRQLWLNPGAEFVILHLQILCGSDRLANFVQWFAMVGTVMGVSLVAQQVGADRRGQLLAALFAATMPMGILQSSSTQNDYAVTFWLVCAAVFLGRLAFEPDARLATDSLLAAGALGLAVLTKATAYLFIPPLVLWGVGWWAWRNRRQPTFGLRFIALVLILVIGAMLPSTGHYLRNLSLYGQPLGQEDQATYRVGKFGIGTTVSNVLRNGLLELLTPWPRANVDMYWAVRWAHRELGLNPDDPRTSNAPKFLIPEFRFEEDVTPNPMHAVLLLALLAWPFAPSLRGRKPACTLALAIAGGAILFCAYLRWQPWGSRLLLPLLLLGAAPLGLAAQHLPRRIATTLAFALLILAIPWLVFNESRPLIGGGKWNILTCPRQQQYFVNRPNLLTTNFELAGQVNKIGLERVGMILGPDDYEYPFWVLAHAGNPRPLRLEQMKITNASQIFEREPYFQNFQPQAVIDMRSH